ncbi:MAG: hypothetical protein M1833_002012 [Piccolia ochrophora]|nr:MAG: hypothetical protein M1833_002012 [Piccolia ochrophora]
MSEAPRPEGTSDNEGAEDQKEWGGAFDPLGDPEERRVLFGVLDSFRQYASFTHHHTTHLRRRAFYALPTAHWTLLSQPPISYLSTLELIDDALDTNAQLASLILRTSLSSFALPEQPPSRSSIFFWQNHATANDHAKASTIIRQLARDWSELGLRERQAHFDPVLSELTAQFPLNGTVSRNATRVLVPGAGLGRLVFDICAAGFHAEGTEISYHALLTSSFILNHIPAGTQYQLHPFVSSFSNRVSRASQLRAVQIPDVHPGTALDEASRGQDVHAFQRLEMSAGDFCVVYAGKDRREAYDAVATVFFLDTAPNIIRYVETVRNCLKSGGVWVNLGPLLWHFEGRAEKSDEEEAGDEETRERREPTGIAEPGSVELTDEEVLSLIEQSGFTIERHEIRDAQAGYIQDAESMLQSLYRVSFWVARKL